MLMPKRRNDALTRRELIQRSGLAAGALLLPEMAGGAENDAPLPSGVKAVWDRKLAYTEKTPTRERTCLNGLWRWQPVREAGETVPAGSWGYFLVPGSWPGITDYLEKDSQTVFAHADWKGERLGSVTAAWYQREMEVPGDWAGRRIALYAEYINSLAAVYVDGKRAGEIHFQGGELDITALCHPGAKHVLSFMVTSLPLKAVMLSYTDTNAARQVRGTVERRGLCGDVFLVSMPKEARIADVYVATSVRKGEITLDTALANLAPGVSYALRVQVHEKDRPVHTFTSPPFHSGDLHAGHFVFSEKWKPTKLWDLHTPENLYTAHVELVEGNKLRDAAQPVRFG